MIDIIPAARRSHLDAIRDLFREYERFLDVDLCFQRFEAELAGLPGQYAPPRGLLLLAMAGGRTAGCVAVRPLGDVVCEMKRLFVRPAFLGRGIGRQLARSAIERARAAGYTGMRLDTLSKLIPAIHLYRSLGFTTTAAYYDNPLPGVVYMQRDL